MKQFINNHVAFYVFATSAGVAVAVYGLPATTAVAIIAMISSFICVVAAFVAFGLFD
ncbi:MAG: hypothetical protein M3203_07355 [Actinomycetota bacterium]|nr:hypothetical protein [Actinomycetota bacterium]